MNASFHRFRRLLPVALVLASLLLLPATALRAADPAPAAATAPSPVGHWEGAIDLPGTKLAVLVDLALENGRWSGKISIPQQGAKDLPLVKVEVAGENVSFAIADVPGDPTFRGKALADGKTIAGQFTQGGKSLPFSLERRSPPSETAKDALAGLDDWATKAMASFEVPGMSVVVVKGGKVALAKGYGLRDREKRLPVTTKTLFAIGSATKAFTTFTLGTLVDEGKLEWDKPVRNWIPTFRLQDPVASERLTPRDLVTHRSGLPRHDLLWYNTDKSRKEMVDRLPFLPATADLREKFQYNNLMFLTAGYLVEQVTGKSWEESVRERVFAPLGMTGSNFSVADSQKSDDFALPYAERDDKVQAIPFKDITNVGPAGAINSNADDLAKWLLVHLADGKVGDRQVIRKETLDDIHTPRMATSEPQERPEVSSPSYALGWFVDSYRGHRRIHHGGAIDGFIAMVAFFPDDDLGIAVLSNQETMLPDLAVKEIADRVLGLSPIDWSAESLAKRAKMKEARKEAKAKKISVRKPGTKPSHPLADYAGEYEHPGYGLLRISLRDGKLEGRYGNATFPLEHWHYDVWNGAKGKDQEFEDMKFLFRSNAKGNIDAVLSAFEPTLPEAVFAKKPDARLSDPKYLARYLGKFEVAGLGITTSLRGKALVMEVTGQGTMELVPGLDEEFDLKELTGYSVKFQFDAKGNLTAMELRQPDGIYLAKKKP